VIPVVNAADIQCHEITNTMPETSNTKKPKRKQNTWQQFHEGLRAWEERNGIKREDRRRHQWGYGRVGAMKARKGAQK
jgi:predicted secreted Zn-dependent protease